MHVKTNTLFVKEKGVHPVYCTCRSPTTRIFRIPHPVAEQALMRNRIEVEVDTRSSAAMTSQLFDRVANLS